MTGNKAFVSNTVQVVKVNDSAKAAKPITLTLQWGIFEWFGGQDNSIKLPVTKPTSTCEDQHGMSPGFINSM